MALTRKWLKQTPVTNSSEVHKWWVRYSVALREAIFSVVRFATERTTGARFPAGARDPFFPSPNRSRAHPVSHPTGARGSFPGDKAARAWSSPFISTYCRDWEYMELHISTPPYVFMTWCLIKLYNTHNFICDVCSIHERLHGSGGARHPPTHTWIF